MKIKVKRQEAIKHSLEQLIVKDMFPLSMVDDVEFL